MTGTSSVKPPTTDAQWARNVQKRQDAADQPESIRAGAWTLYTDPETGNLMGANANGGSVVLATPPDVSEATADETASSAAQILKVARTAGGGIDTISFDAVLIQQGDWTFTAPSTDIVIPRDSIYAIFANIYQDSSNDNNSVVSVRRNGTNIMVKRINRDISGTSSSAQSHSHGAGSYGASYAPLYDMMDLFQLSQGDILTVFVSNTSGVGPSPDTPVTTAITVAEWKAWE